MTRTYPTLKARCESAGMTAEAWDDLHPDWFDEECQAVPGLLPEIEIGAARSLGCTFSAISDPLAPLPPFSAERHAEWRPWLGKHIDETRRRDEAEEEAAYQRVAAALVYDPEATMQVERFLRLLDGEVASEPL